MSAPFQVSNLAVLAFKELRTLDAIELTQARKVFCRLAILVGCQMFWRAKIFVYLVYISAQRLLDGVCG
jgi:hypothetical protein